MKWYKNLKLRSKLLIGFGVVILFTVILAAISVSSILNVDGTYSYLLDNPNERLITLKGIETEYIKIQETTLNIALYSGKTDKLDTLEKRLRNSHALINTELEKYISQNKNDTIREKNILLDNESKANEISNDIANYISQVSEVALKHAKNGASDLAFAAIIAGENSLVSIDLLTKDLIDVVTEYTAYRSQDATLNTNNVVLFELLLLAIIIIISTYVALSVAKLITKPINSLMHIAESVAIGNMNINKMEETKDEIGILVKNFYIVIDVYKSLIDELNEMGKQQHLGDIDVFVNEDNYDGVYKELAFSVNQMVREHISSEKLALTCVAEIADGNFDISMEIFPGKKVFINNTIENLRSSLTGISSDVDNMIQNSIRGNLTARIDISGYHGDWLKLMSGLNKVLEAMSSPIQESIIVLQEIANGNFEVNMTGEYDGDFNSIKVAVNSSVYNISSYINEIAMILNELAENNFDNEITGEYVGKFSEIKYALNNIIDKMNTILADIAVASEQVAVGSRQISDSSMTLAQGAVEQEAAVQELGATVMGINQNTTSNAESAKLASGLSNTSKNNAEMGNRNMNSMLTSMEEIKQSSNQISKIIKVIDDIASQTNLLALNAAIEAAHAGPHGKGFEVVATEVRDLAERSQQAAKETSEMIETSIMRVNEGTANAIKTSQTLQTIVNDVVKVAEIITNISQSSNEQTVAISQVTEAISQIEGVVEDNSSTSEESASASEELTSQAEILKNLVDVFKLRK